MKKALFFILISSMILTSCRQVEADYSSLEIEDMVDCIIGNAPVEFGYCDISDYYMSNYFNELSSVEDYRIYICNESSNFNEFGVFKFTTAEAAAKGKKVINNYLNTVKKEFENGIIYDINEYPKFKDAKTEQLDNYLIYTILNKEDAKNSIDDIKQAANK